MIGGSGTYRRDRWSDDQFKDYIRRYWGFVSFIDDQIGKLLDNLEEIGELDNTIIVFTSDHGDMAGEHGSIYKSTICSWDELMRVPLIVFYPPQVKAGSSSRALVSNVDFLPTLLEMIGTEIPRQLDGKSFKAVLENPDREHREILFTSVMGMNFMATDKNWKYNLNSINGHPDELYDRKNDPDEMNNLIDDPANEDVGRRMKDHIHNWLQETGHPYAAEISK
jgi:arylsulfatase A-like enzyme